MSRNATPEEQATAVLNKAVGNLLKERRWEGEWELFDDRNEGREVSWEWFHDRPNTQISAITSVVIDDTQWWIVAHYETTSTFADLVAFGLLLSGSRNKVHFQFCNVDPRTLNKPVWDYINHPDGYVRQYIKSRDELKSFLAEN
jgi:hypothetical protein